MRGEGASLIGPRAGWHTVRALALLDAHQGGEVEQAVEHDLDDLDVRLAEVETFDRLRATAR